MLAQRCLLSADFCCQCPGSFAQERALKYALLLYMAVLPGAASLCSSGTVLKEHPSVGGHPAVCNAVIY